MGLFSKKKKLQQDANAKASSSSASGQQSQQQQQQQQQQRPRGPRSSMVQEQADRARFDRQALSTADRESKRSLIALAYQTTTTKSFRDGGRGNTPAMSEEPAPPLAAVPPPKSPRRAVLAPSRALPPPPAGSSSSGKGCFARFNPVHSSFFRGMCDDAFDSIDADGSGKIDESELYRGLLLIHLKLGLYFGAPACKPLSADNARAVFRKLDANHDGSLDKEEFRSVLALLMGNVVARIIFQFVCTLVIVPLVAATVLEKAGLGWSKLVEVVVPAWEKYEPLLEVAVGWDLVKEHAEAALSGASDYLQTIEPLKDASIVVADRWETIVAAPIREVPQETWDALPLTIVSTMLSLMIVPLAIHKTDESFQFLAQKFGGGSS